MDKFWICYVEGTDGGTHRRHPDRLTASNEAERLARQPQNRGRNVYICEAISYCEVPEVPVKWHDLYSQTETMDAGSVTGFYT